MKILKATLTIKQISRLLDGVPITIRIPDGTMLTLNREPLQQVTEREAKEDLLDRLFARFDRMFNSF
jgi:hypothetical protein